jgi:hypothetical protein
VQKIATPKIAQKYKKCAISIPAARETLFNAKLKKS